MAVPQEILSWLRRTFELQDPKHARMLPMEGLRGLAVGLVFLQHYGVQALMLGLPAGTAGVVATGFAAYGNLGVEVFFVLSGYLIYGTLVRRKWGFLAFMARRVQRIYPAFLPVFAFALCVVVATPGSARIPVGLLPGAAYLIANLAFLPGLFPIVPVVTVAWTLSYEMAFYVAVGMLVLGLRLDRAPPRRRLCVLGLLTAAFLAGCCIGIPNFPVRMMPFFVGMLLAEDVGGRLPTWLGWALPAAVLAASMAHFLSGTVVVEAWWSVALGTLCAACFRGARPLAGWMSWAPLRWLGNISYSYYLAHGFVVRIAMVLLGATLPAGLPPWLFWVLIPVLFAATLVASAMLFICVEKPLSLRLTGARFARTLAG